MDLGYARVSKTEDQNTKVQINALKEAGCEKIFEEIASGGRWDRPELHRLLDHIRKGDTLVVWKLDRLSRSLKDLLVILDRLEKSEAGFRSLTENVDTTTSSGRALMQMLGVFAEFERAMIKERTKAGLQEARKQGRVGGRKPKLNPVQTQEIIEAVTVGRKTEAEMARLFDIDRSTVCRLIGKHRRNSVTAIDS
jgi:DNA invertase Pin-like site-specific DNA recombinase